MPRPVHTVEFVDAASGQAGNGPALATEKLIVAKLDSVPNTSAGAGVDVTTAVAFANELPANYAVFVTANQDAIASVTTKTSTGFNVVLTPKTAAASIAAGTFDVLVVA